MNMEGGVIVNEPQGMTDRQAALIAATITISARYPSGGTSTILRHAETYLEWLRRDG